MFRELSSGKGEIESGAAAFSFGLDPNTATVALDNLLADGKSNPGARILTAVVQALEHAKYLLPICRVDSDAVVAYTKPPKVRLGFC